MAQTGKRKVVYMDIFSCRTEQEFYRLWATSVLKQISDFENSKTFQKKLRTVWQLQQHVSYCLFGSKKHLMNELFERRNLPFYKFGDAVYLTKIETKYWVEYICRRFAADTAKQISSGLAQEICRLVDNHSSYVQQLSWLLWIHTTGAATDTQLSAALEDLLDQNNILFQNEIESLSSYQMNFLRAIIDGVDSGFSRKEVLQKYNLGTSANIIRLKNALLQKELIETDGPRVTLSDPVFGVWFKKRVCIPPA